MSKKRDKFGYPVDKAAYDREQARLHQEHVWKKRAEETEEHKCAGGCGYPVAQFGMFCGECLCEEDTCD